MNQGVDPRDATLKVLLTILHFRTSALLEVRRYQSDFSTIGWCGQEAMVKGLAATTEYGWVLAKEAGA